MTTERLVELDPEEVWRRLESYGTQDESVFRHLYDFGKALLDSLDQATERLDNKARVMIVWNAGLVAFVLTQLEKLSGVGKTIAVVAGFCALVSGLAAFLSLRVRDIGSFSDEAWFPDPTEATRTLIGTLKHHIFVASVVRNQNRALNQHKGKWLLRSQGSMVVSVALLSLIVILWSASLRIDVR